MDEGSAIPAAVPSSEQDNVLLNKSEIEKLVLSKQEDVTLLCDALTKIRYVSDSCFKALGYRAEEFIGDHFVDYLHADDLGKVTSDWQRLIDGLEDYPIQFRARHKEGHWLWFEARASDANHPQYGSAIVVNLRLVEHHQRLKAHANIAQRAAKIGTWRWSLKDKTPQWSDALFQILGYPPSSQLVDLDWMMSIHHEADQRRLADLIVCALDDPKPFHTTARVLKADGEYCTMAVHAYVEMDHNGKSQALVGVNQDITAQVRAERSLRQSERDYRLLAEESTDLILRYDGQGVCTFVSAACETILGFSGAEALGTNALEYVLEQDRADIVAVYEQAVAGKKAQRVTYRANKKDGAIVWLEASVRSLYDRQGKITEMIVVARDVTERQVTQESLKAAHVKAETASRTKSRFLANMSHELRTPLNAIIGFSDIMCEEMFGPVGTDQYGDYSKLIRESGQFLLALINDILDMSKIEAGRYDLYLEDLRLEEILNSSLRVVEQKAHSSSISITHDLDDTLPAVRGDERTVKQIFLNLLSNALKFTPDGGSVHIHAGQDAGMIKIHVKDTGCGIPAEDLPRLAQPFEQVTSEATHAQSGTGLGLALVKSFVALHGGVMEIESDESKGTCVCFTLPRAVSDQVISA